MYNHSENQIDSKKGTKTPLHIDINSLGITFCNEFEKEPRPFPYPSHTINQTSPFLSPPSSTNSSTATSPTEQKAQSFPRRTDVFRSKCQLRHTPSSGSTSPKVNAKSWEGMKSPAASFLASFCMSPTPNPEVVEETEGDEIDDYVLDKVIGYGGFATVRKGFRISDGKKVAIKIIKKDQQTCSNLSVDERLERELDIWKNLDHANILCIEKVLETDNATFLVCDYCSKGNLLNQVKGPLTESKVQPLFVQLCRAVQYLHEKAKICHKDLKLENILLDQDSNVKLCDFGLAIYQQPRNILLNNSQAIPPCSPNELFSDLECAAGSLPYASPEQIKSTKAIACPSADIWSLGVILYALVSGKLPFSDDYEPRLQQKILRGEFDLPENISADLETLIKKCLALRPEDRPTISQVLQSSWCSSN
ncbi:kinase-like protein [Backusella circina FSU 941]|nr:kinase-like protein [Backusella circina FSU 941]